MSALLQDVKIHVWMIKKKWYPEIHCSYDHKKKQGRKYVLVMKNQEMNHEIQFQSEIFNQVKD